MKFKRLTSAAGADFEPAFDLYGVSFPIHEQRLIESQRSIMTHPEYLFDLIYDDSGEWCGDMLYWETADFIYVEHFCILPERRGQRCGQRALELLGEKGYRVVSTSVVPDERPQIEDAIRAAQGLLRTLRVSRKPVRARPSAVPRGLRWAWAQACHHVVPTRAVAG